MSTNIPQQEQDCNKNHWESDDDDNWEDWGDANDNPEPIKSSNTNDKGSVNENRSTIPNNLSAQKTQETHNNSYCKERTKKSTITTASAGWGSMFGGVVSSVLSTASEGLGNITSTVTHGLDKVIGVPDPEEMARLNAAQEAKINQDNANDESTAVMPQNENSLFGLNLVTGVTTLGSKVLNSGLDTLEGIGKKTMNILQENDPLLKDRIKKLAIESEKPNLSELLKQAKQENEEIEQTLKQLSLERSKAQQRFEVLFENNCGLVHMEALEILSKESQLKIETLKDSVSGKALEELLETMQEVQELLELEELEEEVDTGNYNAEELQQRLQQAIADTELNINFEELTSIWSNCLKWLSSEEAAQADAYTVFSKSLSGMSETCAMEILKLHKIAELLLVKDHHSTANEVDGIIQLTQQFIMHTQALTNRFASVLTTQAQREGDAAQTYVSTLFREMLEARQHIEIAFKLFLPILQIGAV